MVIVSNEEQLLIVKSMDREVTSAVAVDHSKLFVGQGCKAEDVCRCTDGGYCNGCHDWWLHASKSLRAQSCAALGGSWWFLQMFVHVVWVKKRNIFEETKIGGL